MAAPLWQPGEAQQNSRLARFWEQARHHSGQPLDDYNALHAWSVEQPEAFWQQVSDFCGLVGEPGNTVITRSDRFQDTRWFTQATLNFA